MPDVQYLGHSCVRIRGKEGVVICDPFAKANGVDPGRPTAQIVTLSVRDGDQLSTSAVRPGKEDRLFVIDGPGEYEVGGVMIDGIRTYRDQSKTPEGGHNTIYVLELDEMKFCHLGYLGHELTTHQLEDIGTIDVLFVPANSALASDKIAEVIASIEPRAVVPLYDTPQQLEKIAHELGLKEWEAQDKLAVTPSSLPGADEETRVIILRPAPVTS